MNARKTTSLSKDRKLAETADLVPPKVGEIIAKLRAERSLTLDDLSRAAGVSKSMLSEIERDKANPTIAVAWRLANALGMSLDQLFSRVTVKPDPIQLLKPHDMPSLVNPVSKSQLRICGPMDLAGRFEWYELALEPGGALISDAHEPGTREHLSVVHGTIEVESSGAVIKARVGDLVRYSADVAHSIRNVGAGEARAFMVVVHQPS